MSPLKMSLIGVIHNRLAEFRASHFHAPEFVVMDPWTYRELAEESGLGEVEIIYGLTVVVLPWAAEVLAVVAAPPGALAEALQSDLARART